MIELNELQVKMAEILLRSVKANEKYLEYNELAKQINENYNPRNVGKPIGEISKLCHELGLPLLSAKVVSKGKELAGNGFFGLCEDLGIDFDGTSKEEYFHRELEKIRECTDWQILANYLNIDIVMDVPIIEGIISGEINDKLIKGISEGAKKRVIINKYERNAHNRKICINYYKKKNDGKVFCQICGFDFAKVYGEVFQNIIHVHHKTPLYKVKQSYVLNPQKDLIPVCPNCHIVIHSKKDDFYTIDEVKDFLQN